MSETPDQNPPESDDVWPDRRAFVKRAVAVTAFTAPMVASYDLSNLSPSVAQAAVSNTIPA